MGLVQIGGEIRAKPLNDNFAYLDGKLLFGPESNRPNPGTANRLYVTIDTGIVYADTGTEWIPVGGGSVPAHASTHATGGSDPLTPADIGAASQVDFDAHKADTASTTKLGHVKIGEGISVTQDGVISNDLRTTDGQFTRDMSLGDGVQNIAVGFKPKVLFLYAIVSGVAGVGCWGYFSEGGIAGGRSIFYDHNLTPNSFGFGNAILVRLSPNEYYMGVIQNTNENGFTVEWTRTGNPIGSLVVRFLAIR